MSYGIYLSEGRNRIVYSFGPKYVLKVPKDDYGLSDNYWEYDMWCHWRRRPDTNGIVRARCHLLKSGCLVMERVDIDISGCPGWAKYVDTMQVGRALTDGVWVAYDYGIH